MKKLKIFKTIRAHYAIIAIVVLAMSFNGCEQSELLENPAGSQLAVVKYTTTEQLELGVRGIYGQLRGSSQMTTFYVNGWSGDDMTTHRASNKADFREYDQRVVTPNNTRSVRNWRAVYQVVRAANTVLFSVEGQELPDRAAQDKLVGQTYFIRGLMFFHLVRIHGRIPLVLSLDPSQEITLASTAEVYAQVESDMLMAESLLPTTSNNGSTEPSSGSARAILARLYLDWAGYPVNDTSKYAQAASSAKSVMDGGHGFTLVPDMNTLWSTAGRFNKESLFTIAHCDPCGLSNRKMGMLGLPAGSPTNGWQETFAEIRFYEDFPEGPRKDATYHHRVPLGANGKIIDNASTPIVDYLPWQEFKDQQNPVFKKIVGPFEEGSWKGFRTSRNDYYMRYAELLLIYAEASGRAGSDGADAWEALNMVRRRAAGKDINTPDPSVDVSDADGTIEELTYTERKWELAGEYLRWYDLVRMQRVQQALSNRNPRTSIGTTYDSSGNGTPTPLTQASNPIIGSLGTDNYFAPIPQQEIDQHPALGN